MKPKIEYLKIDLSSQNYPLKEADFSMLDSPILDSAKSIYNEAISYSGYSSYSVYKTDGTVTTNNRPEVLNSYITAALRKLGYLQSRKNLKKTANMLAAVYDNDYSIYQSRGAIGTALTISDDSRITTFYPALYADGVDESVSIWAVVRGIPHRLRFAPMNATETKGIFMFPEYLYRPDGSNRLSEEVVASFDAFYVLHQPKHFTLYAGKSDVALTEKNFSEKDFANNLNLLS